MLPLCLVQETKLIHNSGSSIAQPWGYRRRSSPFGPFYPTFCICITVYFFAPRYPSTTSPRRTHSHIFSPPHHSNIPRILINRSYFVFPLSIRPFFHPCSAGKHVRRIGFATSDRGHVWCPSSVLSFSIQPTGTVAHFPVQSDFCQATCSEEYLHVR